MIRFAPSAPSEEYGIKYTPIEPAFWADLIDALSTRHRKDADEYHARVEGELRAAKEAIESRYALIAERNALAEELRQARRATEEAQAEIARLKPIAIELERFKRPLPTMPATGIGGVVPEGNRLEIE